MAAAVECHASPNLVEHGSRANARTTGLVDRIEKACGADRCRNHAVHEHRLVQLAVGIADQPLREVADLVRGLVKSHVGVGKASFLLTGGVDTRSDDASYAQADTRDGGGS